MLSWWRAEDDANDVIGGRKGQIVGAKVQFVAGRVGRAFGITSDGAMHYVSASSVGLPLGNADRTMEMWVRRDAPNPDGFTMLAGYGVATPNSGAAFHLEVNPTNRVVLSTRGVSFGGSATLVDGAWTHIAAVHKAGFPSIYVNGSVVDDGIGFALDTKEGDLTIGAIPGDLAHRLAGGAIDDLAIYDRALDPAEIANIVARGAAGKCP
jgi:hypothetical protein